jgi:hypothetical protein
LNFWRTFLDCLNDAKKVKDKCDDIVVGPPTAVPWSSCNEVAGANGEISERHLKRFMDIKHPLSYPLSGCDRGEWPPALRMIAEPYKSRFHSAASSSSESSDSLRVNAYSPGDS